MARNKSIRIGLKKIPGYRHDWRGPIIAFGKVGPLPDPKECRDIDMNDFRHVVDHLVSFNSDRMSSMPRAPPGSWKVKGVKINCLGDQKMFNKPPFEEIEVSPKNRIFQVHDTSDIADRIGLPIFTMRCFPHPNWADARNLEPYGGESPYSNQEATFLHLCCDPKAKPDLSRGILGWGWASASWKNRAGSAIVVRQDKRPLSPFHVETLCRFCFHEVGVYMPQYNGPDALGNMPKNQVLYCICKLAFSLYWNKMVLAKREKGEIFNVPSPYAV